MFIRFFFRSSVLPPSKTSILIHVLTFVPVFVLYTHLNSIGSPRRDSQTGALIGSGEDLNMHGVTEWCWDIIYVTWACQIGSAAFGEWFWWLYLCVRFYVSSLFEFSLKLSRRYLYSRYTRFTPSSSSRTLAHEQLQKRTILRKVSVNDSRR